MTYPRLLIDAQKLKDNAAAELQLFAQRGVEVMGVNKVFNGQIETAQVLADAGMTVIAESRIKNLQKIKNVRAQKCLLRSPALSEIEATIELADISLNTELAIVEKLSRAAMAKGKVHHVLFMVDMGDLREGIWFEQTDLIRSTLKKICELPGISLYGLGTNFNCFGAIKPTHKNGKALVTLARQMERELGIKIPRISGGSSTSYYLFQQDQWPEGINHVRIGGLHIFGIDYINFKYVPEFHHSSMPIEKVCSPLYTLQAEIIEISTKPSVPFGESGLDAFLRPKVFQDRGIRKRAIVALGRQDLPCENIWPVDISLQVLGQSSDHTIIDIEQSSRNYKIGDMIDFEIDYTALLHACQSPSIEKVIL